MIFSVIRSVQIEITECTCMRDIFQYFAFKARTEFCLTQQVFTTLRGLFRIIAT